MDGEEVLKRMGSQEGKRFFITGANSGVGYSAAVELARRGALVVLGCRSVERGKAALARLKVDAPGPGSRAVDAELVELDLASLESVRRVAEGEVASGTPLHGLINNAGVMAPRRRQVTKDGFELQFGTNVLGHFALTCRLMPALQRGSAARPADPARVVTVSSIAHKRGKLNLDDLQSQRRYSPMKAYAQSKLANLMFAFELERRFRNGMRREVSIAVHPGVAESNLVKFGSSMGLARVAERVLQRSLGALFNSELGGSIPTLFAATSPDAKGGAYYGSQGFREMRGGDVGDAYVAPQARDEAAQRRLWEICETLTGVAMEG